MKKYYTDEVNAQVVMTLLKAHGIRKVIASPGTTNMALVGSMQNDPYFDVYSAVDERSAAYIACGFAAESGEPVVISCTGATASRNYLSGLTEAYYRKLPVLAITSMQALSKVGHHVAQVIDRSSIQNDVAKLSVALPIVKDDDDLWECEIKVNRAILELKRHGGGPVHINLTTKYSRSYSTKELPAARVINRVLVNEDFPVLSGRIAVFIGAHKPWTNEETVALDDFCASNNAVVFCDHTSGYKGRYRLLYSLVACQEMLNHADYKPDVLIHIGEITGDYASLKMAGSIVWRVSEDGEIRDTFRKLRYIFEMPEKCFFEHYAINNSESKNEYFESCFKILDRVRKKIPDIPFSNIWLASKMAHLIPEGATIHFGILNSLRSWNLYEMPASISASCNVGGFGIDGGLSSLVGASLTDEEKLYYCVIGDLAFFYDMNVMGNRHVGKNIRILLVNNGKGTEFRQYGHVAAHFGDDADKFISAGGHFGQKSTALVKHYAEDLGFEYLTASGKDEFESVYKRFLSPEITSRPMLFEAFTDSVEESKALEIIMNIEEDSKAKAKKMAKNLLGEKSIKTLRNFVKS